MLFTKAFLSPFIRIHLVVRNTIFSYCKTKILLYISAQLCYKNFKQECISVGCATPASVTIRGCTQGWCTCLLSTHTHTPLDTPCPDPHIHTPLSTSPISTPLVHISPGHPLSRCILGYTAPVDRMTHACENSTLCFTTGNNRSRMMQQ